MIDLAVDHARSRVQFGRPIGSFQAVRNRLADAHVAREGAAAALASAWDADDAVLAGLLAKSLAGRAARIAATQCQQVLAGIGFTAEHPFHRFLARALVLDSVLGSAAELPKAIGARLDLGRVGPAAGGLVSGGDPSNAHPAVVVDRDGPVACVTLARPEKANAMDAEITDALLGTVLGLRDDADVRAMVLTARAAPSAPAGTSTPSARCARTARCATRCWKLTRSCSG